MSNRLVGIFRTSERITGDPRRPVCELMMEATFP
jgi:hypothetical protein